MKVIRSQHNPGSTSTNPWNPLIAQASKVITTLARVLSILRWPWPLITSRTRAWGTISCLLLTPLLASSCSFYSRLLTISSLDHREWTSCPVPANAASRGRSCPFPSWCLGPGLILFFLEPLVGPDEASSSLRITLWTGDWLEEGGK